MHTARCMYIRGRAHGLGEQRPCVPYGVAASAVIVIL